MVRLLGGLAFAAAVIAGTLTDEPATRGARSPTVIVGDFHVHAAPGDGVLSVWEIQREAARRGVDVVAITNHNQNVALRLAAALRLVGSYPIVIPGQELTTARFHVAAIGVEKMIDWGLPARDAIAAIHAQGGVAIAAHPVPASWTDLDPEALRALDGAEVSHPLILGDPQAAEGLRQFYQSARSMNADLAPIGSTDFHGGHRLGLCRTYLIVNEISREGVLDAIRNGRTVATGPAGQMTGSEAHIRAVEGAIVSPQVPGWGYGLSTWIALAALLSIGVVVLVD